MGPSELTTISPKSEIKTLVFLTEDPSLVSIENGGIIYIYLNCNWEERMKHSVNHNVL